MRNKQILSIILLIIPLSAAALAEIEVVHSLDFEYYADLGYYNVGDNVDVADGIVHLNVAGDNYAKIKFESGNQILEIGQGGGSAVDFMILDLDHDRAWEYFYDYKVRFGQVSSADPNFREWITFVDSAGWRPLTRFSVDGITSELKLEGTSFSYPLVVDKWYHIHFHLKPDLDAGGHANFWMASIWVDGVKLLDAEEFGAINELSTKARYIKFQNYYNAGDPGTTKTQYDDFNWAVKGFVNPPPPADCEEIWLREMGMRADLNQDCMVNLTDFAMLFSNWLENNDPTE